MSRDLNCTKVNRVFEQMVFRVLERRERSKGGNMMTKYCKGCGVRLQDEDREAIGYTPNLEKDYCQRCFRIPAL